VASNSIAKSSLLLDVQGGELNKGLDSAQNRIKGWANQQAKTTAELSKNKVTLPAPQVQGGASGGGGPGGMLGMLGKGGPVVLGIAAAVAAVAGAAIGLKSIFDSVAESVGRSAREARNLGTGLEGLTALQYAARIAGVETADLSGAMMELQTNLAASDSEAGRLFGQLGLSAQQLRDLPIDEATAQIADALNRVEDPARRAQLALSVFGDRAVGLRPLLDRGGAGIRSLTDAARASGIAVNEVQAQRLNEAREAVARLGANWEGLKNNIAQAIAPVVQWGAEAIRSFTAPEGALTQFNASVQENITVPVLRMSATVVDVFSNLGTEISSWASGAYETVSGWANDAGSVMSEWGQNIADEVLPMITAGLQAIQPYLDELMEAWDTVWSTITGFLTDAQDLIENGITSALEAMGIDANAVFQEIADWINYVKDLLMRLWNAVSGFFSRIFGRSAAGDAIRDIADTVEDAVNTVRNAAEGSGRRVGEAIGRGIASADPLNAVRAQVLQGITKLESELRDSIQKVGLTGAQAKIFDLRKQGATDDQLAEVERLAEIAKNVDIAFANIKMPPLETFQRSVEGLNELLEAGRITEEQYGQGLTNAAEQLSQAVGAAESKSPSGMLKDSKEAVSQIIKSQQQEAKQDPQEQLRRAILLGQDIQKKQLAAAERLCDLIQQEDFEFGTI
jgi:hypothetical protein